MTKSDNVLCTRSFIFVITMVDESPVNTLLQNYGPFAGWFLMARVRAYVCVCVCVCVCVSDENLAA